MKSLLFRIAASAIRFDENDVRAMGRTAAGVGAMRLHKGDEIRGMDIVEPEADLLVVTEGGYAKRTPLSEYTLPRSETAVVFAP